MWKNNGGHNRKAEVWWKNARGYIEGHVWINGMPRRIRQHRWVMEQHLGRPLFRYENVHHVNGQKADNRLANLELIEHGQHSKMHNEKRIYKKGYTLNLTVSERKARSERMKRYRAALRRAEEGG